MAYPKVWVQNALASRLTEDLAAALSENVSVQCSEKGTIQFGLWRFQHVPQTLKQTYIDVDTSQALQIDTRLSQPWRVLAAIQLHFPSSKLRGYSNL